MIVDGLDHKALAQPQAVLHPHQTRLHVSAHQHDQLQAACQQGVVKCLGDIAPIAVEIAPEVVQPPAFPCSQN